MAIENPVGNTPKDPYEEHRLQKENRETIAANSSYYPFIQVLIWARSIVESLLKKTTSKPINSPEILRELKEHLVSLKKRDRSLDVDFSNALSICWNNLLTFHRKHPSKQLRALIKEIQTTPKDQDYTFGYYLTEYAGQNWLPLPYIELLKKFHADHNTNPAASILTHWTQQLDQLIVTLAD